MEKQVEPVTEEAGKSLSGKEFRERKFKRLMYLVKNSKAYSKILKEKLQKNEAADARKENIFPSSFNKATKSKNFNKRHNLGEILTKENIEQNVLKNEDVADDEDYFKETKVTPLGFTVSSKQPALLEGGVMKDYQLEGLYWMRNLLKNGVNGILADEMGLGKTIQTISFICKMIEEDICGPFLIVAPLSTLPNWLIEFEKFAPQVPVFLYHGNNIKRRQLQDDLLKKSKVGNKTVYNVVLTSYEIPVIDKRILKKIIWYYLIIDEGHRLKNYDTQLARTLREFNTIGRMLLTGTPLQNNLLELWSLLHFLLPEVFTSYDDFECLLDIKDLESNGSQFIKEKFNLDLVNILQEILHPFLLRREKKDVNIDLPPKKKILIKCPMTLFQKELYEECIQRNINSLLKTSYDNLGDEDDGKPLGKRKCFLRSPYAKGLREINQTPSKREETPPPGKEEDTYETCNIFTNPTMQLRKIVNHPFLVKYPVEKGTEFMKIDEDLVTQCGKMLVLDALLSKLKARGHKVLIFSYFKIVLDILEDYANMRGYTYVRLDGNLKSYERAKEIASFNSERNIFIFFLSERAGGLGINLTAADTVIMYDSDWNPQVNLQCENRCHRIGQTKPVIVYVLSTMGTVDERIIERGLAKRRLEKMILQNGKYTYECKKKEKMDLIHFKELLDLFQTSSHDVVYNSNGYVFSDEQLEYLLDRSCLADGKASLEKGFEVLDLSN